MGITAPSTSYPLQRKEFGIHSIAAISRTTGLPLGMAEIIGDASVALEASSVDLRGGSNLYPRATEITEIDSSLSFNLRTFPDWVFETYMAGTVTTTAASATTGTVSALDNYINDTVFDSSTGVATATLKTDNEANMKMGTYIIEAASATTVDVYSTSNFQFTRGTDLFLESDVLKITASALTITAETAVEIPGTGIELTGGDGVIAMTVGDVAIFQVFPPHGGVSQIAVGVPGNTFPEHQCYLYGKERASGEKVYIWVPKAVCVSGFTYNMSMSDFSTTDVTLKLLVDSTENFVAKYYFVAGTAS